MTIQLRAHHLLCLLTYIGKGYSDDFIRNCNAIVYRLTQRETILIVDGPDDICAPLLDDKAEITPHCLQPNIRWRDKQAAIAIGDLLNCSVTPGLSLTLGAVQLHTLRAHFAKEDMGPARAACVGCEWFDLCTMVARSGFKQVKFQ